MSFSRSTNVRQIGTDKPLTLGYVKKNVGYVTTGNSKMPGTAYSSDPMRCHVGGNLVQNSGTVCSGCYAISIAKYRPNVGRSWARNLDMWRYWVDVDVEHWIECIASVIQYRADQSGVYYHRWFDAGDIDSVEQLQAIDSVCKLTPNVNHWLPTRERNTVRQFVRSGVPVADNLTIRYSMPMIDMDPVIGQGYVRSGIVTSTVHSKGLPFVGRQCPSTLQGNQCLDCRSCWDRNVPNVSYIKH